MGGMAGMGGMGGGYNAAAPAAAPAAAAAAAAPHSDGITEVKSLAHFNSLLKEAQAQGKPVIVDFTAVWCGPCQRIAPLFHNLAASYHKQALFLKVDGDKNQDVVSSNKVTGFPTFHFYENGSLIDSFSGADGHRLQLRVQAMVSKVEAKENPPSPYQHFPLKESEVVSYKECKFDLVLDALKKNNNELKTQNHAAVLSDDEIKDLEALSATLNNIATYQTSSISASQYALIDRMLSWPADLAGPPLHLLRMLVRHPHGANTYAKACEEKDKNSDAIAQVVKIAAQTSKVAIKDVALRTLINFFGRRNTTKVMGSHLEIVFDSIASLATHEDSKLRLVYLNLMINYAILFTENPKAYEEGKILLLSSVHEILSSESDKGVFYRAAVVLGTLIFRDPSCKQTAIDLEIPGLVRTRSVTFADNQVHDVAREVTRSFESNDK